MTPAPELLHYPARVQVREDCVTVHGTEREVDSPIDERAGKSEHLRTKYSGSILLSACTRTGEDDDEERERVGRERIG